MNLIETIAFGIFSVSTIACKPVSPNAETSNSKRVNDALSEEQLPCRLPDETSSRLDQILNSISVDQQKAGEAITYKSPSTYSVDALPKCSKATISSVTVDSPQLRVAFFPDAASNQETLGLTEWKPGMCGIGGNSCAVKVEDRGDMRRMTFANGTVIDVPLRGTGPSILVREP